MLRSKQYFFQSARVSIASRSDSVMSRTDDFARETRASSEGDVAPGLSLFVTEASMPAAASTAESAPPALWEFPAEGSHSVVAGTAATGAAIRKAAMYASVAVAVGIGSVVGTWGARALQRGRPVATQMAAPPIMNAPVVTPPVDALAERSAELIPSMELGPSIGAPVARVVANPPPIAAAVSQAVPDDRQPRAAAASTPRGTSGGASAAARTTPAPRPRTEPVQPAAAPMATMNPAVTLPSPEAPSVVETPTAAAQPAPMIPAAIARPEPEALPSVVARSEQNEIQHTLGQYRSAYQRLDAQAAQAVWPSVDVRALARAFGTLSSQELAFETCLFDIAGPVATAQCRGSATYTPKVGGRGPKAERRQWTFHLRKVDEAWKIESAQARQ
jgi:hypothetical protein